MDNSIKITLIIAGTLILLTVLVFAGYSLLKAPSNTVNVNGISEVKTLPDIVAVYLNIETNGSTATIAKDKNAEISEKVSNALINIGIEEEKIATQNYNIYENFDWTDGERKSIGFKASNQLRIELNSSKMNLAGSVIDAGVDAGATISYINFELSQEKINIYKAQALEQATQDAKIKADAIAKGLGKKVGRIVSVSSQDFGYRPWPLFAESTGGVADAKEAVTDIQPGEQSVSASVSVTYKLA